MKKQSFVISLLSFFVFLSLPLFSLAQTIETTLATYADKYQPEKVYLHYDKASYYPGETIWFKAYLMEGIFPAAEAKTLYVDWVADNGEVLHHSVSPVVDAATNGQFQIPENYSGNFIHVKAYTKWMLNFDTAFLYSKDIRVISKNTSSKVVAKPAASVSLQFFPEGGDAVAGITNKIAFKATNQWGLPVKVKGVIQNNKGAVIDSFRSVHDGMGSFVLLPQEGANYTAKWKDEKGAEHITALPAIKSSGVTMQVMVEGTKRIINFQNNATADNLQQLHLLGTINQHMAFKTEVSFTQSNGVRRVIPTESLPSGILTITLFDDNWNAIAERITFVNNHDYNFQPKMEVQHWGLSKRARNEILITVPDSLQGANLSVSVTDAAIDRDTSNNIVSHFLLSSDLKGQVYNPTYYFSNASDSTAQYLDLVMLTNGWRRFKWEDVTKGKLPSITYPKDTSYLTLSGKVYGVAKSQLSGTESIFLFIKGKDSGTQTTFIPLNRDGTFNDPNFIFFDTLKVYYQLKSKLFSSAEARFMADRLPAQNYLAASKNFLTFNPFTDTSGAALHSARAAEALSLQNLQKGKMMENITVTAKTKPPLQVMDEKYANGLFSGGDGYQFDLTNDPFATSQLNIFNYLQGKVAGLQITTGGGTPTLSWRGGTPTLYLDEMPVDADLLNSIPVNDIAYVKVFRPPFMGTAGGGSGGAIAIYTRKGEDLRSRPGGLSTNTIMGYTPIREFYSPNYGTFDKRNEQKDVRTTLYWNPMVITNAKSHAVKVSFYNNDVTKSFRVVIEGMTKEGLLTHHEEIME